MKYKYEKMIERRKRGHKKETNYHTDKLRSIVQDIYFPRSMVQFLWSLNKSYLNYGPASIVFCIVVLYSVSSTKTMNRGFSVYEPRRGTGGSKKYEDIRRMERFGWSRRLPLDILFLKRTA
jgi:hypothetical protein